MVRWIWDELLWVCELIRLAWKCYWISRSGEIYEFKLDLNTDDYVYDHGPAFTIPRSVMITTHIPTKKEPAVTASFSLSQQRHRFGLVFLQHMSYLESEIINRITREVAVDIEYLKTLALFPRPGSHQLIAVIDTGIFLNHDSFKDTGIPPPLGLFNYTSRFNNKVIRTKSFTRSTIHDYEGHGTHVASLAAGNIVEDANVNGNGRGIACGTAPLAHLLIYNVWNSTLGEVDKNSVYEAIKDAIEQGVDVISISLKFRWEGFDVDPISKGACRAAMRNILVVCAGGNDGPHRNTLYNHKLPWILLVGASHKYTSFVAMVELNNHITLRGESIYPRGVLPSAELPLVYFASIEEMEKHGEKVAHKLVALYDSIGSMSMVMASRFVEDNCGNGLIIINNQRFGYSIVLEDHGLLPTINISHDDGLTLYDYYKTSIGNKEEAAATLIFLPTEESNPMGRAVAGFSSRGPDGVLAVNCSRPQVRDQNGIPIPQQGVLKPDVICEGVNILGASHLYPKGFVVNSGTSMACPSVAGWAAVLTREYSGWSKQEIKSALMKADTTDKAGYAIMDQNREPAKLHAIGCGHVNIDEARNPGLLYDVDVRREIPAYLRGFGHTNKEISEWVGFEVTGTEIIIGPQLNYKSFAIEFGDKTQRYTRKVRNVGGPGLRYKVDRTTDVPSGVVITVTPDELRFSDDERQSLEYEVGFELISEEFPPSYVWEGSITWKSDKGHLVRSPIVAELKVRI